MKRNRFKSWISQLGFVFFIFSLCIMSSCKKDNLSADESTGADSPTADGGLAQLNRDIADMQQIAEGKVKVLTYTRESSGRYLVELDNELALISHFPIDSSETYLFDPLSTQKGAMHVLIFL